MGSQHRRSRQEGHRSMKITLLKLSTLTVVLLVLMIEEKGKVAAYNNPDLNTYLDSFLSSILCQSGFSIKYKADSIYTRLKGDFPADSWFLTLTKVGFDTAQDRTEGSFYRANNMCGLNLWIFLGVISPKRCSPRNVSVASIDASSEYLSSYQVLYQMKNYFRNSGIGYYFMVVHDHRAEDRYYNLYGECLLNWKGNKDYTVFLR